MNNMWLFVGFAGQGLFGSRFLIQWIYSEIRKESLIPQIFWYLSICGSLLLLAYAIYIKDPVFIMGNMFNSFIYLRNIILIKKSKKKAEISV